MPVDGGMSDDSDIVDPEPEDEGLRDAVLVTDADNPTAEQVILQLILSRCTICYFCRSFSRHLVSALPRTMAFPYAICCFAFLDFALPWHM